MISLWCGPISDIVPWTHGSRRHVESRFKKWGSWHGSRQPLQSPCSASPPPSSRGFFFFFKTPHFDRLRHASKKAGRAKGVRREFNSARVYGSPPDPIQCTIGKEGKFKRRKTPDSRSEASWQPSYSLNGVWCNTLRRCSFRRSTWKCSTAGWRCG